MLISLNIRNFALIDEVSIDFDDGLNIFTGESGAGKSIIIEALNLVLGDRADKDMIRSGSDKAEVEAVFSCTNNVKTELEELGLYEDDSIIVYREISANGRSICKINNRTVNLSLLKKIASGLIDIHSQNQHHTLFDSENHISLLDAFGDHTFNTLKDEVSRLYSEYVEYERKIKKYKDEGNNELEKDLIKYQINEISASKLQIGEEDDLIKEKKILSNGEKIFDALTFSYNTLYGEKNGQSILDELGEIVNRLQSISEYDNKISDMLNITNEAYIELQDVCSTFREYLENMDFNPEKLNRIEERLNLISNLKRKYGGDIRDILKYKDQLIEKIKLIENNTEIIKDLESKKEKIYNELKNKCGDLTKSRKNLAEILKNRVSKELYELGIKSVVFDVAFGKKELNSNGVDKIEFMISTNPGEALKPLAKIASGGEVSRVMLAFKKVFAEVDGIETLVFDEIDTGISGQAVQTVATKILDISRKRQVICITHMPQIASLADIHYSINKIVKNGRSFTTVEKLSDDKRVIEISRILSGDNITPLSISHSKEMVNYANKLKEKIAQ